MNRNQERDIEVRRKLASMGWHSITIWECELKPAVREQTLASLAFTLNHIFLEHHKVKRYEIPEENDYAMVAEDTPEYNSTHKHKSAFTKSRRWMLTSIIYKASPRVYPEQRLS